MPISSLPGVKAHLRVTGTDDDSIITAYCDAAEAAAEHYCNRSFGSPLPPAVQAAVFLMVGDMYENREQQQDRPLSVNMTCENLLNTVKDWSRASVGELPVGVSLDGDPIIIGDDWSRVWTHTDASGAAVNVTGYTGTFELFNGDTSIYSAALTVSDALSGKFSLTIANAITATFTSGERWYRVRITSPANVSSTIDRKRQILQ
jgi:uncharacterized phage protein (predicted DNA packaging)